MMPLTVQRVSPSGLCCPEPGQAMQVPKHPAKKSRQGVRKLQDHNQQFLCHLEDEILSSTVGGDTVC